MIDRIEKTIGSEPEKVMLQLANKVLQSYAPKFRAPALTCAQNDTINYKLFLPAESLPLEKP
jgi:hypothetical protein